MHSAQEFVAEDLGEEDIVGLVLGFELVATDGAVGAAVEGAEGGGNVLGELRAGGGVNGLWEREAFDGPESDDFDLDVGRLATEWSGFVNLQRH
jgi:hypothetical protein